MYEQGTPLYYTRKDLRCLKCGHLGAYQSAGSIYPSQPTTLSPAMGFGGTIPFRCTNCNAVGLYDYDGLEGLRKVFEVVTALSEQKPYSHFLYIIHTNLRCMNCGHTGAVEPYGKLLDNWKISPIATTGDPFYECTNCNVLGLDYKGLEGDSSKVFEKITREE